MIHEYFQRGVAAGFVAGLAYGLYMAFVGHPLSGYVANVASGHVHEGTESHDHATQIIPETTTILVSVGSGLLWAVFLGGVFSVALYFIEPALPGGDRAKAYILASAGFFNISIVPWLALPPAVPGAELSYDISLRIGLYLGLVVIGLSMSGIAITIYNRLANHHTSIRVSAGISPIVITAIILQLTTPTVVIQPNLSDDLITAYQGLVVFSQAALWFLIATAFTQLQQRSGQSRTTESTEKSITSS